ncbi:neutral zinc metallopeptidase [Kribbella sp. NPDC050459]|uniref:neutral zinc metallopeptidase n=1 Tax=Kribbella sp. NPDC050459 TaxID=3155785 RepID=UPI00340432E5
MRPAPLLGLAGLLVAVVLAGGCTRQVEETRATPTATPVTVPVRAPVGRLVQAPEPVKEKFLLDNQLYRSGQLAAVRCSLPDAQLVAERAMIRYATAFVACLDRAWEPVITRAGFDFVRPSAVFAAPPGTRTACGEMEKDVYGMYCQDNRGIYFNWPEYVVEGSYDQKDAENSVQWLIGHEYGHHVQWLTGIADQYGERYWAASGAARQAEEDRSEMQAHCFAAAVFGANRETLRIRGDRLAHYGHPGYDRHASDMVNFDRWMRQAFEARGPAGCNTWPALAKRVS